MVRRLSLACALALGTSAAAPAQQLDVASIDKIFEAYARPNTPGCVLGVGRAGRLLYGRGYGMANLEYDIPLTDSTVVEIGSVSKQFTASAILLLAGRGVLSLDDDIRKWLPEVPDFGTKITIRMLAHHTSGLRDQWGLLGIMNSPPGSAVHTPELVLDLVSRQRDLNFKPNDQYLYSNTGYTLLGIIVKRASGKSLAEFSRQNIFEPLGMKHTQWRDDYTRIVKGRATAYSRGAGDVYRQDMPFTNVYGNGGLLTTVGDLMIWWDALYNDQLGQGLLTQLTTAGVLNNRHTIGYALGVSNDSYRGLRMITHSGSTAGYRALLASFPESRTTVAVLCNNAAANASAHARSVADIVLAAQLAPATRRSEVKAATNINLDGYVGLWRNPSTDDIYRLSAQDGRLMGGGIELIPTGRNSFHDVRRNAAVTVVQTGGATTLRVPGDDTPVIELVKVAEVNPDAVRLQEYAGTYTSPELGVTLLIDVGNGNLIIKRRLQSDMTIVPAYADAFTNFGSWMFTRDATGQVNGVSYSQGRVRRVRFDKTN